MGGVALAEGMAGHGPAATTAINELDELAPVWMKIFDAELVDRGRAWAWVSAGEISRGRQLLKEAAEQAAASDRLVAEARLRHDIARLGEPASVVHRLAELKDQIVGNNLVAALADHVGAMVQASAPGLEAAALIFEAQGASLLAAEASLAAAAVFRAEGSPRRASASAQRAGSLLAMCGDVSTPGLARGLETDRLTRREREVAGLAVTGLASRDIAARLFLSVRTVDNHLQSAYSKLGVTSREGLAQALGPATGK
jgi:DNA-binding NarL/FixJ family response regulator